MEMSKGGKEGGGGGGNFKAAFFPFGRGSTASKIELAMKRFLLKSKVTDKSV